MKLTGKGAFQNCDFQIYERVQTEFTALIMDEQGNLLNSTDFYKDVESLRLYCTGYIAGYKSQKDLQEQFQEALR